MRIAIAAAVAAAILLGLYLRSPNSGSTGPQSLVGRPAVSFAARDVSGANVSLQDLRGKIVVLNFWASWCAPCREEMPDLERAYEQNRAHGVVVVGVDEGESAAHASDFARSLRIRYPIWLDNDQQYGRRYASLGLPATVVIDRNGVVVRGFDGPLTGSELTQTLASVIAR